MPNHPRDLSDTPEAGSNLPTAIWTGTVSIGGFLMRCSVLDNGQRIFDADDFEAFWKWLASPEIDLKPEDFHEIAEFSKGRGPR